MCNKAHIDIQGTNQSNWPVPIIDPLHCDGCGLCVKACPSRVLSLRGGLAVVDIPERCNYAGLCEQACPRGAIQRIFEIIGPAEVGRE